MEVQNMVISPDTIRKNRIPPGQHLARQWPVLHYGRVPKIETSNWSLRIFGEVIREITLNFDKFMSLPRTKVFSDIHCVTTWSLLDNTWEGVSTADIRSQVELQPDVAYVIVHAYGGFSTNLTLSDFLERDVLLAVKRNNEPLQSDHGGPVRLVVPRLYFWKSAKWVNGIEFAKEDRPGFWESNGYHNHGDPWKEERYG